MKETHKKVWLAVIAILITALCSACTLPGIGEVELTKLTAPEITVQDGMVRWNSVPNASGYTVRINGKEDNTSELSYRIASLIDSSGEVHIKVKARGSALYADSEWSGEEVYQYIKTDTSSEDLFEQLQPYGIGYGYNVITKGYFKIEDREKAAAILDTKALAKTCRLVESKTSGSLTGSLFENSIETISSAMKDKFFSSVEVSGSCAGIFTAGMKASFRMENSITKENYGSQYYYSYYDDQSTYDQFLEYKSLTNLQSSLSETFLSDLAGESVETSGMTAVERAKFLIRKYGTHLIVGVKLGGKMECNYTILTNEEFNSNELKTHLDATVRAGMNGMFASVDMSAEAGYSAEIAQKLSRSSTSCQFYCVRSGGSSVGTWTMEELSKNYSSWAASFNDASMSKVVGASENGLIALWNLIPEEYMDVRLALKNVFEEEGANAYDSFLSEYVSTELKQYSVTFMDGETKLSETSCLFGTRILPSALPEKENYICVGWFTDSKLTQAFDVENGEVRKELVLYGKWEPVVYTVKFSGTEFDNQLVGIDQAYLVSRPEDPQRPDLSFEGWYADSAYQVEFDFTQPIDRDTTIYAKWNDVSYPIEYVLNGGQNDDRNGNTYSQTTLPLQLYAPSRFGYSFVGWYRDPDFDGAPVEALEEGQSGELTLYARWEACSYPIEYVLNGGQNDDRNGNAYSQTTLPLQLYAPSRFGYSFVGWYRNPDFDGAPVEALEKGQSGKLTLYARWEACTSRIEFLNPDGAALSALTATYGENFVLPQPEHRDNAGKYKDVYVFDGWFYGETRLDEAWDFVDSSSGEFASQITLKARWSLNQKYADYTFIFTTDDFKWHIGNNLQKSSKPNNCGAGKYMLMNDIDLGDWNEGLGYTYWTSNNESTTLNAKTCFTGVFDGNNYTITYKLRIGKTDHQSWAFGLFPVTDGATIKNLKVKADLSTYDPQNRGQKWDISNDDCAIDAMVGGLVGYAKGTIIENCSVSGQVIYNSDGGAGDTCVAGIVGYAYNSMVSNCSSSAEVYARGFYVNVSGVIACYYNTTYSGLSATGKIHFNNDWLFGGSWSGNEVARSLKVL